MLVILGILAVLGLGGIIYLFISPKSTKMQKSIALGALVLSGLALLICVVIIILNLTGAEEDPYAFPLAVEAPQPVPRSNIAELVVFLLVLLLAFGIIIFIGIRDYKRREAEKTSSNQTGPKKAAPEKAAAATYNDSDSNFDLDDL